MSYEILQGDCIEVMRTLPSESVQMVCTSPPYFSLRDYGTATWEGGDAACDHVADASKTKTFGNPDFNGTRPSREATKIDGYYFKDTCGKCGARRIDQQIGLEETPDQYIAKLVTVFNEARRLLRPDGVLWLNLGDSYAGSGGAGGDYSEGGIREGQPKFKSKFRPGSGRGDNGGVIDERGQRNRNGVGAVGNCKPKDLIGIPWMAAFALRSAGWWLRSEIIWHKKAPMPESATDRPTRAHEQVFLLTKSAKYFYDAEAIREPNSEFSHTGGQYRNEWKYAAIGHGSSTSQMRVGIPIPANGRNKRSVWTLGPEPYSAAHFATMPTKLAEPCILAGSRPGDTVLDPFAGSGTTLAVALKHHRDAIGIELNPEYIELAHKRIGRTQPTLLGAFSSIETT